MLASLTDPRKTTEAQAQQLIKTREADLLAHERHALDRDRRPGDAAWSCAYRLVVEETPFIQQIRNNVITFITPVIEVDGREKHVDTVLLQQEAAGGGARALPLMYWGKYVAHDNNRDGMGQFLALTKNMTKTFLEWKPTILHDLHEAQTYLYASTGTGPVQRADRPDHDRRMVDARARPTSWR